MRDQAEIEKSWQMPKDNSVVEYLKQRKQEREEYWNSKININEDRWLENEVAYERNNEYD